MLLVDETWTCAPISLEKCSDTIYQIMISYVLCPVDICKLIAQFVVVKQARIYSLVPEYRYDIGYGVEWKFTTPSWLLPAINDVMNWSEYSITRGDIVILCVAVFRCAIFDGEKLINIYNSNNTKYSHPGGSNYHILLPEKLNMLEEFGPNYWWGNSIDLDIHAYIDLNKYIEEINNHSSLIVYNDYLVEEINNSGRLITILTPILITWSYFTHNGNITLVYTTYKTCGKSTLNIQMSLTCIIKYRSDNVYNLNHPFPKILDFLEKHTSICKEYHLHVCANAITS